MARRWDHRDLLQIVWILVTITSVIVLYFQIRTNTAMVWRTGLDAASNDYDRLEVTEPAAACIYQYNVKSIDDDCTRLLRQPANLRKALSYVEVTLEFLGDTADYSNKYDKEYKRGYDRWGDELARLDITGFYLRTNKIDAKKAAEDYSIHISDADIERGYRAFRKRINLAEVGETHNDAARSKVHYSEKAGNQVRGLPMSVVDVLVKMPWWYIVIMIVFSLYYSVRGIVDQVEGNKKPHLPPYHFEYSKAKRILVDYVQEFLFKSIVTVSGFIALFIANQIFVSVGSITHIEAGTAILLVFLFLWGVTGISGYLTLLIATGRLPGIK